jgi:hypothetical protein
MKNSYMPGYDFFSIPGISPAPRRLSPSHSKIMSMRYASLAHPINASKRWISSLISASVCRLRSAFFVVDIWRNSGALAELVKGKARLLPAASFVSQMDFLDDTTRVNNDFDDDFAAGFYNTEPEESEPPSEPLFLEEPSDDDEVVEVPKPTDSRVKKRLSSPEITRPTKRRRIGKSVNHLAAHHTEDK